MVAASKVGTGGYALPAAVSVSRRLVSVTPGWTVTWVGAGWAMAVSFDRLSTTSPRGVAPPVSDDCAPTGRTVEASSNTDASWASFRGKATAGA